MESDKKIEDYKQLLEDCCEEDSEIRKIAREVLTEKEVYGNHFGFPPLADVIELLVGKIKKFEDKKN